MKTPYNAYPLFIFNFVQPLAFSFCCLVFLTKWAIAPHLMCYVLLHDIMDLHMLSVGSLVPQGPCGVFYATRHHFNEV